MLLAWTLPAFPGQEVPDRWDQLCWRIEARGSQDPACGCFWKDTGAYGIYWRRIICANPHDDYYVLWYGNGAKALTKMLMALNTEERQSEQQVAVLRKLASSIRQSVHGYTLQEYKTMGDVRIW
jgi:hypothetical protein